jgi:PadR family transcriptional regulator PadR
MVYEQSVVLLEAYAVSVLDELDRRIRRSVSRGTLYKTLERMETKGLLGWTLAEATPERGGHPRRRFRVTAHGVTALQNSRDSLFKLWDGLDAVLEGSSE